ncbi:right-handed parallel beta-helix repeat-containing protein [Methanobrevibacter sp.]|uniref:right-handed parallel beta-helix repeat-containing protein n=1 Tax=Methanobrevibacter sp. TaxID=66852 RepID=UPI00388F8D3D
MGTITRSSFKNNWAENRGGAISARHIYSIDNSHFEANTAKNGNGGAIYISGKTISYHEGEYRGNIILVTKSTFKSNSAKSGDGGAIYVSAPGKLSGYSVDTFLYIGVNFNECNFTGNYVDGGILKYNGGAICSDTDLSLNSCYFKDNWAKNHGGAIYTQSILYYSDSPSSPSNIKNSYFENNDAKDGDGGAIYINRKTSPESFKYHRGDFTERTFENCYFINNHAIEDGGAIYANRDVNLKGCTFKDNKASGAKIARCYGGAIRSKGDVKIDNSSFLNNYAADYGGAIYADTITWISSYSFFIGNTAGNNDGGAIYTNKFTIDVKYGVFINNTVKSNDNGGAIYINKENWITFSQCVFVNNHCGNKGGAIYLDSSSSHLILANDIFVSNSAKEGDTVYNSGKYDSIKNNWWGGKNPSSDNDQLVEWKMWPWSNIHHTDSNPLRFVLKLSENTNIVNSQLCATAGFYNNNVRLYTGEMVAYSGEMVTNYISFIPVSDIEFSNRTEGKANVTILVSPQKEVQYTITANLFGQFASDILTVVAKDRYGAGGDLSNEADEGLIDSPKDSSNALIDSYNAPVNNRYNVDGNSNNLFGVISDVENTNYANSSNKTQNNSSVAKTIDNQSNGSSFNYLWILLLIVIFAGAGVLIKQYKN